MGGTPLKSGNGEIEMKEQSGFAEAQRNVGRRISQPAVHQRICSDYRAHADADLMPEEARADVVGIMQRRERDFGCRAAYT